ncbi:hypothetical protein Scep_029356 [Stephania cephalantha]|uniref:Protein kinase domain-containing protein n=1 Tax=Stephania cephalantha TaxID=152367 RepID=A0AAP0DXH8_9MAGN
MSKHNKHNKHKQYARKVDVYSFGLILWEMLSGTIPFQDMSPIQAAFAVTNKNMRPVVPADCPPPLRALVEHILSVTAPESARRPHGTVKTIRSAHRTSWIFPPPTPRDSNLRPTGYKYADVRGCVPIELAARWYRVRWAHAFYPRGASSNLREVRGGVCGVIVHWSVTYTAGVRAS